MKKIVVLGSTGSIGVNTLNVIRRHKDLFEVVALSANKNVSKLIEQASEFRPSHVVLSDPEAFEKASEHFKAQDEVQVLFGEKGLVEVASFSEADFVMAGMVGASGLRPFLVALESGKTIGLANKEVLVMAGEYLQDHHASRLKQIIPVDSEHSAIFQCLQCGSLSEVGSLIVTASGGPFRKKRDLSSVTLEEALDHPNWDMGSKITIDSATLMNKGFEVMEARWLFSLPLSKITVSVHPQSIIHSMVSFQDGSIIAHLGTADMQIPIQYALSFPDRLPSPLPKLDFNTLKDLTFEEPDLKRFPCLQLALEALERGNVYPAILNASNEVAVAHFLQKKISFLDIPRCNRFLMENLSPAKILDLNSILEADSHARKEALIWISKHS